MLSNSSPVPDRDVAAFFETGCSTVLGFVLPSGEPFASRAWGTRLLAGEPLRARVLIPAATARRIEPPFALAMTGADVRTLRSVQAKGQVIGYEPLTADDRDTVRQHCDEFFTAVEEADGTPRSLVDRMVPTDLVAATFELASLYDQTPGPGAGARL